MRDQLHCMIAASVKEPSGRWRKCPAQQWGPPCQPAPIAKPMRGLQLSPKLTKDSGRSKSKRWMNWDRSCECGPSSNLQAIRHPDVYWILAGPCYLILGYPGMCGFWSQAVNIHWESQAQMQNSGHQQLSPLCVQWHHPGLETCSDLHHKLNSCSAKFLEIQFQPSPNTARTGW